MAKRVEFQGAIHEFPDDATDDQIRQALSGQAKSAPQSSSFLGDLWQEGVVNPAKQVAAGVMSASASANRLTSNALDLLDKGADLAAGATGTKKGGAFRAGADYFRSQQKSQEKTAAELSGGRQDFPSQVYRGVTQGALELPQYAIAGHLAGPVAGVAAVSGLSEADQGWQEALKAAALGGATGGALKVMGPGSRQIRLTGAAAMTYAQARLSGADNTTALAHATTMGLMSGAPEGGKTVKEAAKDLIPAYVVPAVEAAASRVPSTLNPVQQAAVDYARGEGNIRLSAGTITGNKFIQAQEALTQSRPFGSTTGSEFRRGTEADLQRNAGELLTQAHPQPVTPESAGVAIPATMDRTIKSLADTRDAAYEKAWEGRYDPNFTEQVPVRTERGEAVLNAEGKETGLYDPKPVMKPVNMPVDIRELKEMAAPILDQMRWRLAPSEQNSSAGFHTLEMLIKGDDYIPAWQAEDALGGLKSMARLEKGAAVRDKSEGIAAHLVPTLQEGIDAAVAKTGGDALQALREGRATHAEVMDVEDVAKKLREHEPVQNFNKLVWKQDTGIDFLRRVQERAPEQMPEVGRAWVQRQMERATREGGFAKTQGLLNDWRDLGPETKQILFPDAKLRTSLDNFFKVADMASHAPNPSGTALVQGSDTWSPRKLLTGYIGSKLFFTPQGIELLTRDLQRKVTPRSGSPGEPPPPSPDEGPPGGSGNGPNNPNNLNGPGAATTIDLVKEAFNRAKQRTGEFLASEEGSSLRRRPAEPIAAVSLKYLMDNPLEVPGKGEGGQVKTVDMGREIRQTVRASGGSLAPDSEARFRQARAEAAMVEDLNYALASQPEARKWYTGSVQEMEAELIKNRPEFQDATKRSLFKYLLGVTSNGVDPETNFDAAVRGWDLYNQHGKFMAYDPGRTSELSNSGQVGLIFRANSYESAMKRLDSLVQDKGEAGAVEWLQSKQPIAELKKYDPKITVGDGSPRYGSYVLGEKVGAFGANLNGIYSELTADKWWSRTWNRWMGTTIATDREGKFKYDKTGEALTQDDPRNETERNLMRDSAAKVAKDLNLTVAELQAVLWYAEQALYRAHGISAGSADYSMAAKKYFSKASKRSASSPGTGPSASPSPPPSGSGPSPFP